MNGNDIQRAFSQPLLGLEQLLQAPAKALQDGIHQLNTAASRSGLPQLPEVPDPPQLFSGDPLRDPRVLASRRELEEMGMSHNPRRRGY